jgi:hypothetical protein
LYNAGVHCLLQIHEITLLIASYINVKLQQSSPEGAPSD